jgi:uracil-DNA glycosylase family 4
MRIILGADLLIRMTSYPKVPQRRSSPHFRKTQIGFRMPPNAVHDPALISLLHFWADAGVDCCLEEAPVNRRVEMKPVATVPRRAEMRSNLAPTAREHQRIDVPHATARAQALADDCRTLQDLESAIATFDGCPLSAMGARQAVFARGRPDADIVVIGEGPGAEEDLQGAPFVGRAGRLLDRMLAAANLVDRVFITNTVFWRPPGNRTPTPEEQAICAPFVARAVDLVDPAFVLLLGGAAAKAVLKRAEGILSLRGRWSEWSDGLSRPRPVIASLHPAFLLRQPAAKKLAWSDFLSLAARLEPRGPSH